MPFDSQNPFDPTDPAQWARIRALPHIVVHPKPPPNAPPPDGIDDWILPGKPPDDGPDDWFVPGSPSADGYPNDWFVPPPVAPNAGRFPSGASPNTTSFGGSYPAVPPDPFAAYWSQIPASRVGAMAWDPPNLPLFPPSSTNNFTAPTIPSPQPIPSAPWPRTLGLDSPPWPTPHSWPNPEIPKGGLLDALATAGTSPLLTGGGGLLGGLKNLGTQSASTPSLPKGGILDALAALGTPASASPTSSLGGGSFPGPAGPASPPMPSAFDAFFQGLGSGSRQVAQSIQSFSGPPTIAAQDSPAAEPLGWSDLASPSRIAPKVAYQFAQSYPMLAAGAFGGVAGAKVGKLAGPYGAAAGALIGGSLGAAALSAAQTLGPSYVAELQKTPNDPEGAWNRAWRQAEISGAFSGASWAVFPARFFQSPVKQLVFQMFGAQPPSQSAKGPQETSSKAGR
jgi:hypothetical protein